MAPGGFGLFNIQRKRPFMNRSGILGGQTPVLWPLLFYATAVLAVVGGMLAVSALLGQRHREDATGEIFESGIVSTGSASTRSFI